MNLYKITMVEGEDKVPTKKTESMLKDLIAVLPTLKKHKMEGEIHNKIKTLRSGRKSKSYTLEITRKYKGEDIKVSATLKRAENKIEIMKSLKEEILTQIKNKRIAARATVQEYQFNHGTTVPKLGEVYLEPASFLKAANQKIRIDMDKTACRKPGTNDNYLGIEIELASKKDRKAIGDILFANGLGKYVTLGNDGSIGRDSELKKLHPYTHELKVLVKEKEYRTILEKLCVVLNSQCEVKVDRTCGIHVHLDMRNKKADKCFANLVIMQDFLYAMNPAKRKLSAFSVPINSTKFTIPDTHYNGISSEPFTKYKTLEIRMHSGSTDGTKIANWCEFLLSIVNAPALEKTPTIGEFKTVFGMSDSIVTYSNTRIVKFEKQHAANPDPKGFVKVVEANEDIMTIDVLNNEEGEAA